MKVNVEEVTKTNEKIIVSFESDYGLASATWLGRPPKPGNQYFVEIDFDDTLQEDSNFRRTACVEPSMWVSGDTVHFVALVEDVFKDELTATLRFGSALVLVDYDGSFPSTGTWIEVYVKEFRLNNMDV